MRYVCCLLALFGVLPAFSQSSELAIVNYRAVSGERPISPTVSEIDYRAEVYNPGEARTTLTATGISTAPNIVLLQSVLRFSNVPARGTALSNNTFTIRIDRVAPIELTALRWTFSTARAPQANAGFNQTVAMLSTVRLDGSASTNPPNAGVMTYLWEFVGRPVQSAAVLANPTAVNPSFVADAAGTYVVRLTVANDGGTDSATVTITTGNSIPVANAGPNQSVGVLSTVQLDGSRSSDVNGDPLTFQWSFTSRPAGSTATLVNATSVTPRFVVDKSGTYVIQLIVNDGKQNSTPEYVTISTRNSPPVANAGPAQSATLNTTVQLTGAGSTDVDGDSLTYLWSFNSVPSGSNATLSSTTAVNPTFVLDKPGTYVAQLIVNDGNFSSPASTVTITTNAILPPVANAGPAQSIFQGSTVTLSASGTDPQSQPLTYVWSFTSKPANSNATLSNPTATNPTFTADKAGLYVLQLIANNQYLNSAPATVTITTTGTAPVAVAGQAQTVTVGGVVSLNGSGSSDADGDALTYSWSFVSRPPNSTASLTGPTSSQPTFTADRLGTYVVQLIVSDGYYNSTPVTVSVHAVASLTFTPPSLTFDDAAPGQLTVNLSAPAPAGGVTLNLTSTNTSVVTVPATVTIAQGATSANIVVTPVTPGGTSVIKASLLPDIAEATANVTLNWQDIILPNGVTVAQAEQANFNISLANAPASTKTVTLVVGDPTKASLTLTSVVFNAGQTQPVTQPRVTGLVGGTTTVSASASGLNNAVTNITVTGGSNGAIILPSTTSITQAQVVQYPISLTAPAPVGGVTVTLSSSVTGTMTISPTTVTIPAGETNASVVPTLTGGQTLGSSTITATATNYPTATKVVQLTVPQAPTANAGTAQTVPQGAVVALSGTGSTDPQQLTLTYQWSLTAKPAGSAAVLSSATAASPTFVADYPGSYTAQLVVSNGFVSSAAVTVSITATNRGNVVLPATIAVNLGSTVALPVSLSTAAGSGGVTVQLTASNGRVSFPTPAVFIPEGSTAPAVTPTITGVDLGTVTVTAAALGHTTATQQARVTGSISFSPGSLLFVDADTKALTVTLSGPAPAGGIVVNLASSNTAVATVPNTVTIPANTNSATFLVTGVAPGSATVTASATELAEISAAVTFSPPDILLPTNLVIAPGEPQTFTVTLNRPAQGATFVELTSSDTSKATLSLQYAFFNDGQTTPVAQPRITGLQNGTVTVVASTPGLNPSRASVRIGLGMSFSSPTLAISGATTQNATLNLSALAPAGGVTVTLTSSNPSVATVPASVTIPAGGATAVVPVTGVTSGSVTVLATSANAGDASISVTVSGVTAPTGNLVLPSVGPLTQGQSVPFPVSLSAAAGTGGVTINLVSNSVGVLTVSPATVTIQAGQTQPASQPQVTAVGGGTATVTGSATGYQNVSTSVQVIGTPAQVIASSGTPQSATVGTSFTNQLVALVRDAGGNGLPGIVVTFTPPATGAGGTFAQGVTTATTNASGLATSPVFTANSGAGTYIVAASVAGVATPANFTLTNTAVVNPGGGGGGSSLSLNSVAVGQNLQKRMTVTLPAAAPAGGRQVTVQVSDGAKLLVAGRSTDTGSAQLTFLIGEGLASGDFFVQGLASSGTVTVTAMSSGLTNGTGTVTLYPAGFTLTGVNGPSNQTVTLGQGSSTPLTVTAVRLDASFNVVESQEVRGGQTPAVTIANLSALQGSPSPNVVTIAGGSSTGSSTFNANGPSMGNTVLTATAPSGFNQPTAGADTLTVTVIAATMSTASLTVGENLQVATSIRLNSPSPAGGMTVTISSTDPAKVLFAKTATEAGSASIVMTIPAERTGSADFYVQSLANSGTVPFNVTSPGFGSTTGTVTLTRSGFVLMGPFGVGTDFFTVVGGSDTPMSVLSMRLDPGFLPAEAQAIRGGVDGGRGGGQRHIGRRHDHDAGALHSGYHDGDSAVPPGGRGDDAAVGGTADGLLSALARCFDDGDGPDSGPGDRRRSDGGE